MEMIYHVHLTKTDFENIKHLQLTLVFRHLLMLSLKRYTYWKSWQWVEAIMKTAQMKTSWNYRISEERNVWPIERNQQQHKHRFSNYLEKAWEMRGKKPLNKLQTCSIYFFPPAIQCIIYLINKYQCQKMSYVIFLMIYSSAFEMGEMFGMTKK